MIDYPSKPPQDFFQAPFVSSKAMESTFLNLIRVLVEEKLLTEEKANRVFDDLGPLIRGVNGAHEIGLTVSFWRRTLAWLLKQERALSSKRAA